MGGCTSDVYSAIKKEHGEMFKKYIVGSQSLTLFKRQMKNKLQELEKRVQKRKENLHAQVRQREEVTMYHFNETKLSLDASLPGGTSDYEQMKKVKINTVLGLPEYKSRFSMVHEHINKQIHQRKQKIQSQMQEIVLKASQQYTIDAQKMQNYHDMSEERRAYIRQRGVKEYEPEIKNRLIGLQTKYLDQLSLDLQMRRFEHVIALQRVDQLAKMAQNKFKTEAINILGGFIDSNIKI